VQLLCKGTRKSKQAKNFKSPMTGIAAASG